MPAAEHDDRIPGVTVTNATVSGGQVTLNNTNVMASLTVSGGTLSLPVGGSSIGIANFVGNPAPPVISTGPLTISNKLLFSGSVAATISGASNFTFTPSGGNFNTATNAGTMTLSGGVLTLTPTLGYAPTVNVFVGAMTLTVGGNAPTAPPYVGPGPDTQ